MESWTPLWSRVVDSSLWEEPPFVRILFLTMLAVKDADHICRCDEYNLKSKAKISEEETAEALRILSAPDTKRKVFKQEFEGRRIEKVSDGWLILNGEKYRSKIQTISRKAYKAQWARENRKKEKQEGDKKPKRRRPSGPPSSGTVDRLASSHGQKAADDLADRHEQEREEIRRELNGNVPQRTIPEVMPEPVRFTRPT